MLFTFFRGNGEVQFALRTQIPACGGENKKHMIWVLYRKWLTEFLGKPRKHIPGSGCTPPLLASYRPGVSRISGMLSSLGSLTISRKAEIPIWPFPMSSWRSSLQPRCPGEEEKKKKKRQDSVTHSFKICKTQQRHRTGFYIHIICVRESCLYLWSH